MQKSTLALMLALLMVAVGLSAQNGARRLSLPNLEQLSSQRVLHLLQDSEGFLWYATDGGGVCRDDGRQVDVFRNDAEHPDLLGSNSVVCLAEAGNQILIGTTHGANVLDKRDYSIRRLTEVDDKRVDDIIVTGDGHWWLTANKKVYEYSADGQWLKTYPAGDKYIFRLHEDRQGRLWCRQWEGATLRLDGGQFVQTTADGPDSVSFNRVTIDNQGRQLVADGFGACYVLSRHDWEKKLELEQEQQQTSGAPAPFARYLGNRTIYSPLLQRGVGGEALWFSTGKDIRCLKKNGEETVVSSTKDVSAMAFTPDGILWLATIYGQLYRYHEGTAEPDEYGSNEYGDGVITMRVDSIGRLVLVSDRYIRQYDTRRHTLRQQSREADGVYCIELQETAPHERWSQPHREKVVERMPGWMTSWWMWCILLLFAACFCLLAIYTLMLRRQRKRFVEQMKSESPAPQGKVADGSPVENEWLLQAIAQVEDHLSDEGYTVEQLSNDMCMSRMTFYRKLQSLTGQSPTEFVRTIRLRHAAELLREHRLSVTEISYATGFSSVSYFSRCFRAMYGVPPTQFFP